MPFVKNSISYDQISSLDQVKNSATCLGEFYSCLSDFEINTLNIKPGEIHTVKFNVVNQSNEVTSGSASFNVSPSPFGIYLNKIGCFCFEKQTLKAGENEEFILTFFLDPKVVDDSKTKNIADVTLSFTFFSSDYYKKG